MIPDLTDTDAYHKPVRLGPPIITQLRCISSPLTSSPLLITRRPFFPRQHTVVFGHCDAQYAGRRVAASDEHHVYDRRNRNRVHHRPRVLAVVSRFKE